MDLEFEASSIELDQNNTNSTGGTGTHAVFGGGVLLVGQIIWIIPLTL